MKIASSDLSNNSFIPTKYAVDGENINPPLEFFDIPTQTKSLALIVDDPDAPAGTWTHWTLWNIDPQTTQIAENSVPNGATQGKTSRENNYSGPKPPSGTHRYFFRLYALDIILNLASSSNIDQLNSTMKNHIIAQSELIGLYSAN